MPYLRPNTANYFGFSPATGHRNTPANIYLVSSSEADQISPGDVVVYATHSSSCSIRRVTGSTTTDAGVMVGVAASLVVANGGSTAASLRSLTSQNVLVYDDPLTIFVGCDTTSGVFGYGTFLGKSFGVTATGVTGSTGPHGTLNRSVQAISVVTASSQGRFRVIGLHPVENALSSIAAGTAATSTDTRKLLLQPDMSANVGMGVGVGHVTT
jgi:hypothetical protein